MYQLTEALWALHEQNIVHLDLKPDNIILNENDTLFLADFGCSV